jgi:hypothetical protein
MLSLYKVDAEGAEFYHSSQYDKTGKHVSCA